MQKQLPCTFTDLPAGSRSSRRTENRWRYSRNGRRGECASRYWLAYLQTVEVVVELRVGEGVPETADGVNSVLETVVQHTSIGQSDQEHSAVHRQFGVLSHNIGHLFIDIHNFKKTRRFMGGGGGRRRAGCRAGCGDL